MRESRLDGRVAGYALVAGYLLLVVALFRSPSEGLATATRTAQSVLFFLVLPALGLVSGVNAVLAGPFNVAGVFVTASYLAAVGVTLALLLGGSILVTLAGLALFALAVVALVGSLRGFVPSGGLDLLLPDN